MRAQELKEYIFEHECVEQILYAIGCHAIVRHKDYITCANKTGDNKQAIVIYLNASLVCINYTRQMSKTKRDFDVLDLVSYNMDFTFPETLKFVCNLLNLDYYSEIEEPCESLQILKWLKDMSTEEEKDEPVKPIPEDILKYYLPYGNAMFEKDGISLQVQKEFGIGYDPQTNRITIPIRTPIGDLCGVKGRFFGQPDELHPKYLYIEPTTKQNLLFGLYENREHIKNSSHIFIFEAEKSVLQCASHGVHNCVALGGKSISKTQAELIVRTGCVPVLALDKGIDIDEIKSVLSVFPENISAYYIYDSDGVLIDKQSPVDDWSKWNVLIKNNIYKR